MKSFEKLLVANIDISMHGNSDDFNLHPRWMEWPHLNLPAGINGLLENAYGACTNFPEKINRLKIDYKTSH